MWKSGIIDEETARHHPDRNCLTSVLCGGSVPKVDCPRQPFQTVKGDIYVVSSDGLQFLSNEEIEDIVLENKNKSASVIASKLLRAITELDDPDQDNLSLSVIKVNWTDAESASAPLVLTKAQLGVVNG
jgi:serine/threonine protein phosphatase PrpC